MHGNKLSLYRTSILTALALAAGIATLAHALPVGPGDTIADRVLGQPDFIHNNGNGVDPASLDNPTAAVIDSLGHLYLADAANNRVRGQQRRDLGEHLV